jgi:hypothetical protein
VLDHADVEASECQRHRIVALIRIDLETGGSTGYVDVPSPCGHAGRPRRRGDGMLYVAVTHTLFATPLAGAFDRGARFRQFSLGPGVIGGLAASTPDGMRLGGLLTALRGALFYPPAAASGVWCG